MRNVDQVRCDENGINATIYTSEEILHQMKAGDSAGQSEIMTSNGTLQMTGNPANLFPFDLSYVDKYRQKYTRVKVEEETGV